MALFETQLELITESDLQFLIENQVREGYQIEYKQAVLRDGKEKQDKIDFLASVTSFANTIGGDLLIGVEALSGLPVGITGWQGADLDKEKLRIENLLRDLVEPRMGFTIREIPCSNGNFVMMIRVPWSWAQPHMLKIDQLNRFYYRHSAGKDIMNVTQLRAVRSVVSFYQRVGVPPPVVVAMSLINVGGFEFATSTEIGAGYYTHSVDRDDLLIPETLVHDFSTSPIDMCRPMFDALFNAAGFPKWPEYEQYQKRG
jgi:hypothetical protein